MGTIFCGCDCYFCDEHKYKSIQRVSCSKLALSREQIQSVLIMGGEHTPSW